VKSKGEIRVFSGWSSVLLFVLIILNNSLFVHVHSLSTGEIITHAHPFNPVERSANNTAKHSHSNNEISLYKFLNHFCIIAGAFLGLALVRTITLEIKQIFNKSFYSVFNCHSFRIRPPPAHLCRYK